MSFIRTKKVKGYSYAYLVENNWKRNTSKQKVKQYLGRVYPLERILNIDFSSFMGEKDVQGYIKLTESESVVTALIIYELYCRGFKKLDEQRWVYEHYIFDTMHKVITKDYRNIVLAMNEGFLCNHTISKLYSFSKRGRTKDVAIGLARLFVDAGIGISKEVYVELFEKLTKGKKQHL